MRRRGLRIRGRDVRRDSVRSGDLVAVVSGLDGVGANTLRSRGDWALRVSNGST